MTLYTLGTFFVAHPLLFYVAAFFASAVCGVKL